jgi:hypothetical protein
MLGSIITKSPQSVLYMELSPRIIIIIIIIDGDEASSTMMYAVARTQDDGLARVVWLGRHHSRHVRTLAVSFHGVGRLNGVVRRFRAASRFQRLHRQRR